IGQALENILHLLFEQLVTGCVGRRQRSVVFDKVTQVAIVLFTNGGLKADRLLADLDDLADFVRANLHLFSDLFRRGFASKVLEQTATDTDQPVDRLHHMNRDTNRARLVGDRASDSLANPPGCICTKLVALRVVEFLDSTNQADISLLDQVQQAHTTANILFCNTYHQAQVCLSQAALCFITVIDVTAIWSSLRKLGLAAFHALRQTYFFLGRKQRDAANLTEIHPHGIIQAAFKVSNHDSEAIVQIIPLRINHDFCLIFRTRLPVCWWLFCWIQGVHRLLVLQFRKQVKRLLLIDRSGKTTASGSLSLMTYRIDFKNDFRTTHYRLIIRLNAERLSQGFRVYNTFNLYLINHFSFPIHHFGIPPSENRPRMKN